MAKKRVMRKLGYKLGLALIIVLGSGLRLMHLRPYLMFQGDQGRDALIAMKMLTKGDVALVGPVTSVGNMYLGPWYYYFMVPWLALTYPDPSGPAYGVAIISCLALLGFYKVAKRELSGPMVIMALLMYAFSRVGIEYSRFSWNPNLAAPVVVFILWSWSRAWFDNRNYGWLLVGLGYAILCQLHYIAVLIGPPLTLSYFVRLTRINHKKGLLLTGLVTLLIGGLSILPLIVFNFRHQNLIVNAFNSFITSPEEHIRPWEKIGQVIGNLQGRSFTILGHYFGWPASKWGDYLIVGLTILISVYGLGTKKLLTKRQKQWLLMTSMIIVAAIGGTAFYSGSIFNHYILYLLPVICIQYAFMGEIIYKRLPLVGGWLAFGVGLLYVYFNLGSYPYLKGKTAEIDRYKMVAQDVMVNLPDGSYNLALLGATKDYKGMNYRYFLEVSDRPPKDPELYLGIDHLVVIDEFGTNNPLEVAIFEIQAPKLMRLVTRFKSVEDTVISIYGN